MRTLIATLILLAATGPVEACGPGTVSGQNWFRDSQAEKSRAPLPIVKATVELRHRPRIVQPGEAVGCDQFARFAIRLQLDAKSPANLSDYGYEFRIRTKDAPLTVLPHGPVRGKVVDGFAEFDVEVYDFGVGPRSSIDVEVEVRAVDRRLRRGPKSNFTLHASAIGHPDAA